MDMFFSVLDATLRVSTPLVLAALAGLFSERSGIVDLALEGKMLAAAFASACVAYLAHSPWAGLGAGIAAGVLVALLHGGVSISYNGNQLISAVAINMMVSGVTPVLALAWFQQGGRTPTLDDSERFTALPMPFADAIEQSSALKLIFGHNILVYIAVAVIFVVSWVMYKSRFGLRLRAVGENPHAADAAGISVKSVRYIAQAISGALCGVAGTYLALAQTGAFIQDMTAGKGYLALAALIFGKWRPWAAVSGCLLFAFTDAIQIRLQGVELPLIGSIPDAFIQAIPYVLTVVLLAGLMGRAVAPKAIGIPFVKSR
ncbi:ABC transporter permease [Vogesella oryzae]|uniref:ABC transporter permease n=1 Tax=Vogesella oryzae TaxID=1735285 RepID=UPI001582D1E7|nr:ABC transporter permease [Vogesella oryzae]